MSAGISVLLADDHTLLRRTLRDRLEREPDMAVVADVATGDEALERAVQLHPNLVVLDIDMPGLSSFDVAARIKEQSPATRVVFLSAYSRDHYIEQALAVEASGYVTKAEPPDTFVRVLHTVAAGATYYSPEVQARIVVDDRGARLASPQQKTPAALTPRELEVLRLIAQGLSKKQIAARMHVSVSTIDAHTANTMRKLDIHDRVELTLFAIREGLVEV